MAADERVAVCRSTATESVTIVVKSKMEISYRDTAIPKDLITVLCTLRRDVETVEVG